MLSEDAADTWILVFYLFVIKFDEPQCQSLIFSIKFTLG